MILILFAIKKILKTRLTSRTQYNLWFLPLCLMAVPFIPVPSGRAFSLFSWFTGFIHEASLVGRILFGIWIMGIVTMALLVWKSFLQLRRIRKSALPLQNREVRKLYKKCLEEMHIRKRIPIYSTAFLKSPVITGLIKPCIYLHQISK